MEVYAQQKNSVENHRKIIMTLAKSNLILMIGLMLAIMFLLNMIIGMTFEEHGVSHVTKTFTKGFH